jgi:hypothetical protein
MRQWLIALLALSAVACSPGHPTENNRTETMDTKSEIRTDVEPLTKRFPAIGAPEAVRWVTWNSASGGAPGPTTYWIDAVITLQPQTTASLVDGAKPTQQGKAPNVEEALRSAVPAGPFQTGAGLDKTLSNAGWSVTGYLDRARNQLVITAMDD